jgi:uncharacterized protein YbjT (DUF2867 family)
MRAAQLHDRITHNPPLMATTTDPPAADLLVAGATGLVGRELVRELLAARSAHPRRTVHLLVRRAHDAPAGTRVHVVDFAALPALPAARHAYCALGTTIAVAGSQPAFRAVDFDAVLAFARAVRAAGVQRLAVVSALGADARSGNFYSRVKGEMEAAVAALGFETLVFARPSLLAGDRAALAQAPRAGERIALALAWPLRAVIPKILRPIDAAVVARAMVRALDTLGPGVHIVDSARLQGLGSQPAS